MRCNAQAKLFLFPVLQLPLRKTRMYNGNLIFLRHTNRSVTLTSCSGATELANWGVVTRGVVAVEVTECE